MDTLTSLLGEHALYIMILLGFISFTAGLIDCIAGGGGLFLLPAFMLAGIDPQTAIGQNKGVSSLGTFSAMLVFFKHGLISFRILAYAVPGALIGAYIGTHSLLFIDHETANTIILILLPLSLILLLMPAKERKSDAEIKFSRNLGIKCAMICTAVGFYDGFFGPGAGCIYIMGLHYFAKVPLLNASADAKAINFSSNVGSLIAWILAGKLIFAFTLPLALCNIAGNQTGTYLAVKLKDRLIHKVLIFSMLCLIVSAGIDYFF